MQFHFPQYIEVEDKLFGPLSLKQAIFLAGGAGASYLVFRIFTDYFFVAVPLIAGIVVLTWALAFFPKEKLGKPFIEIIEAWVSYQTKGRLYTWKRTKKEPKLGVEEDFISSMPANMPSIPTGKLSSTSFTLDVKKEAKEGEDEGPKIAGGFS